MTVSSAIAEVGWGLERVWSDLRLAAPHFREESSRWQSLLQEGSSLTGWGAEDERKAQNCTCLFYDLENNQLRRQMTFFLPSVQKMGSNVDYTRMPLGYESNTTNYGITTASPTKICWFWGTLPVLVEALFPVKASAVLKLCSSICLTDLPFKI